MSIAAFSLVRATAAWGNAAIWSCAPASSLSSWIASRPWSSAVKRTPPLPLLDRILGEENAQAARDHAAKMMRPD